MKGQMIRYARAVGASMLLGVLAACGGVSPEATPPEEVATQAAARFDVALTVSILSTDTRAAIARAYSGTVTSWNPKAGYAVLGLTTTNAAKFSVGGKVLGKENNRNALRVGENAATAKTSGWNAWSGGWNAWSGGWNAWSGGDMSALSTTENSATWTQIRLQQAHALATNLGTGVKVAVIDTGVDLSHPAFVGRLTPSSDWYDWIDGDATPQEVSGGESFGHGTSVAGIISQVAPRAQIMPLRVLAPDGFGDVTNVVAAMEWAVARGARVINLSLGADYLKALESAIKGAASAGVIVVASSGNTGDGNITYPAMDAETTGNYGQMLLGVGSVNDFDVRSVFSTYGKNLEMVAPGETIYGPAPGNMVAHWSGTSMAAPMVSGALALGIGQRTLSTSQLQSLAPLVVSRSDAVDDKNSSTLSGMLGTGRLNLERFIQGVLAL
jgi:thermitase